MVEGHLLYVSYAVRQLDADKAGAIMERMRSQLYLCRILLPRIGLLKGDPEQTFTPGKRIVIYTLYTLRQGNIDKARCIERTVPDGSYLFRDLNAGQTCTVAKRTLANFLRVLRQNGLLKTLATVKGLFVYSRQAFRERYT